jgi:hypothetical protein
MCRHSYAHVEDLVFAAYTERARADLALSRGKDKDAVFDYCPATMVCVCAPSRHAWQLLVLPL